MWRASQSSGLVWSPALIVLGVAVAYANTFGAPFVFDDIPTVVENPALRSFGGALRAVAGTDAGGVTLAGRPLVALSLAFNHALSGDAVWSYHAFNLAVHVCAALTLFGLVRRTLAASRAATAARFAAEPVAFAIALLWAVHPLQTESVTYIVQRAESLMALFYLLTLYAFVRAADGASRWLAVSVAACALGMLTKEVMVTAPIVVLLYDRAFVSGSLAGALRGRPRFYAALAATWLVLLVVVLSTGGNRGGTVGFGVGVTPWAYAATQFEAVARYVGLIVWPHPLVFDYGTFWVTSAADVLPFAILVVPLAIAIAAALWRNSALGFAGAFFFAVLAPTSLTPGTIQMIVEHRTYLSSAAAIAVVVLALQRIGASRLLPFAAIACVTLTLARNADYRDERTLWATSLAARPHSAIALANLGLAEFRRGRTEAAITLYQRALRENPHGVEARFNLGLALTKLGRWAEAVTELDQLPMLPHTRIARARCAAHYGFGNALAEQGDMPGAIAQFEAALRADAADAGTHINLGNALLQLDRVGEAAAHYAAALRSDPASPDAHNNLGVVLLHTGRAREAVPHFEATLAVRPDFPGARENLTAARAAAVQ